MAKKIKQKKSGMIRRQQKKRQQKKIRRRLSMPSRAQNNQESSEKIEELLRVLPTLAFEPELIDLKMNKSEFKELLEKNMTEIDIFKKLLTDEFILDLDSRLTQLVELNPEKSIKSVLAKATQHQITKDEKMSYISNPFLIAIFLKTKAFVEGIELNLASLPKAIEAFNLRNEKILNDISENLPGNGVDNTDQKMHKNPNADELTKKIIPVIEQSFYKKLLERLPEQEKQRIEDDLDVFLVDFQPPPVTEWDLNLVKNFIDKWFIENANPMEDDLESMRKSLLNLFQFLVEEKLLQENFLEDFSNYLKKT